jgi:hypothetical protein
VRGIVILSAGSFRPNFETVGGKYTCVVVGNASHWEGDLRIPATVAAPGIFLPFASGESLWTWWKL